MADDLQTPFLNSKGTSDEVGAGVDSRLLVEEDVRPSTSFSDLLCGCIFKWGFCDINWGNARANQLQDALDWERRRRIEVDGELSKLKQELRGSSKRGGVFIEASERVQFLENQLRQAEDTAKKERTRRMQLEQCLDSNTQPSPGEDKTLDNPAVANMQREIVYLKTQLEKESLEKQSLQKRYNKTLSELDVASCRLRDQEEQLQSIGRR